MRSWARRMRCDPPCARARDAADGMSDVLKDRVIVAIGTQYDIGDEIGRGSMGEVWLAEDVQLPRKVAVKLLPRHLAEDADAVSRLLREAEAAASVDHPAVVTVYDVLQESGNTYIVMELIQAPTLSDLVKKSGPLPQDAVAGWQSRI